MSVVIIGGHDRMVCQYQKLCKAYRCSAKVFTQMSANLSKQIGSPDPVSYTHLRAIHADLYENWTDVSGFLVADPRIVPDPQVIETITYKELRELSYMGASVLHEDAIFPVREEGIPIHIRNTNKPEAVSYTHLG